MAVSLKHNFVSAKVDSVDATLVQPSNWNAEHTLTLATSSILGRSSAGTGVAQEIPVGTGVFTALSIPIGSTGAFVTNVSPTINSAILNDGYTEEVFAITDGVTVNLNPNNGSIQTWTLGASRTPGQVNWASGQSITLQINDGAAFTITWTTLAVVWKTNGGTAPTLNTTGFTVIVLWKVGTTIFGARVGDA